MQGNGNDHEKGNPQGQPIQMVKTPDQFGDRKEMRLFIGQGPGNIGQGQQDKPLSIQHPLARVVLFFRRFFTAEKQVVFKHCREFFQILPGKYKSFVIFVKDCVIGAGH